MSDIRLLSHEQLMELLGSIYLHLNVKTVTADKTDKILSYNRETGTFSTSSFVDLWQVTDPVRGLIDNLISTDIDHGLTANQGKVLKDGLDAHQTQHDIDINALKVLIDALQVLCDNLDANKLNNVVTDNDIVNHFDTTPVVNSRKFLTSGAVKEAIDKAVNTVFKFDGNVAIVEQVVVSATEKPIVYRLGNVYNCTMAGTIYRNGVDEELGTMTVKLDENLVWVEYTEGIFCWDTLGGMCDLSAYATMDWVTLEIANKVVESIGATIPDAIKALQNTVGMMESELDVINRSIQ